MLFGRIVGFFDADPKIQAFITVASESLARPQELCYRTLQDIEFHESYARIWVSSHGKEGTKALQCIDSFPYLMKWYEQHPHMANDEALLFSARNEADRPLTPANVNKKLRYACTKLGIEKRITAYSLKRNGVTFRRLRGDSDVVIQHVAGWTSTRQLQTYDLSTADDVLKTQLMSRGLIPPGLKVQANQGTKLCICGERLGFADKVCRRCKRVTDQKQVAEDRKAEDEIRAVFDLALENPGRSLAELIGEYRLKKREAA